MPVKRLSMLLLALLCACGATVDPRHPWGNIPVHHVLSTHDCEVYVADNDPNMIWKVCGSDREE